MTLALADGSLSQPLALAKYADLRGPISGASATNFHPILQTVNIPLADFGDADMTQLRGVRLTFNRTPTGAIYVTNIRLSTMIGWGADEGVTTFNGEGAAPLPAISAGDGGAAAIAQRPSDSAVVVHNRGNVIRSITTVAATALSRGGQDVEIELFSDAGFPVRDELVVLRIGQQDILLSRYANSEINTLIFTLTDEEFARIQPGDPVSVQYGPSAARERWEFGPVNRSLLR